MQPTVFPPRSYLLTTARLETPPGDDRHVKLIQLPCDWFFYHSGDLPAIVQQNAQTGLYIVLAGLVMDLLHNTQDLKEIADRLSCSLSTDPNRFLEHVDHLAGRFIIIYRRLYEDSSMIMGDATNMLKINYATEAKICSSNVFLIDNIIHRGSRSYRDEFKTQRHLWKAGALGNLAPINGVKILTPNHALNLHTFSVHRFYPRARIESFGSVRETAEALQELCCKQLSLLIDRYTLFNSLTAGIDSRFTLAISQRERSRQFHFTYLLDDQHLDDTIAASRIAQSLNLNHFVLLGNRSKFGPLIRDLQSNIVDIDMDEQFIAQIREWDWYNQGNLRMVSAYKRNLLSIASDETRPPLHVRSNLYEIGRAFWAKHSGECKDPGQILDHSRPDWARECPSIFADFFVETEVTNEALCGISLLDAFYWEHRCGTWVSEVLQGTDFAFDTHSYVNCRRIIALLLSVSFEDRVNASLFKDIIARNLPEIEAISVNSHRAQKTRQLSTYQAFRRRVRGFYRKLTA
jgi:hypothetical protein